MDETQQTEEFDVTSIPNPFLTESSDPEGDAQNLLGAVAKGEETPALSEGPPQEQQEAQPDAAPDQEEVPTLDLSTILGASEKKDEVIPEEPTTDISAKKQQNRGLRHQVKDLSSQAEALNHQLEEKDRLLKEAEERKAQLEADLQAKQQALANQHKVGEYNPDKDDAILALNKDIFSTVETSKLLLDGDEAADFAQNWQHYADSYKTAVNGGDIAAFREDMQARFGGNANYAIQQIGIINNKLDSRISKIKENQQNHFKTVIGGYEEKRNAVAEKVALIGAANEEDIKANPASVNSILSYAASVDPAFRQEMDKVKETVVAMTAGVRPFDIRDNKWDPYRDPSNPGQLSQEGLAIRQAEIDQQTQMQEGLPTLLAGAWASAQLLPKLAQKLAELQARVGDSQEDKVDPSVSDAEPAVTSQGSNHQIDFSQITDEMVDNPDMIPNPVFAGA